MSPSPLKTPDVDPRLTHTPLDYDREAKDLSSRAAGLAYPIRDGVPVMLPEEARSLAD